MLRTSEKRRDRESWMNSEEKTPKHLSENVLPRHLFSGIEKRTFACRDMKKTERERNAFLANLSYSKCAEKEGQEGDRGHMITDEKAVER